MRQISLTWLQLNFYTTTPSIGSIQSYPGWLDLSKCEECRTWAIYHPQLPAVFVNRKPLWEREGEGWAGEQRRWHRPQNTSLSLLSHPDKIMYNCWESFHMKSLSCFVRIQMVWAALFCIHLFRIWYFIVQHKNEKFQIGLEQFYTSKCLFVVSQTRLFINSKVE